MTSTIRIKSGSWLGPVGDGNLRVKWGGNSWISPAYVYHKVGDLGVGSWRDTGYRGYPLAPGSIWVHAWSFTDVALGFTGPPAGGAPAVAYDLLQTDSDGNWMNRVEVGGSPWGNFGVGQDGLYQFYVRSKSAAGLYSGWTGPVRVRIGHTETGYWQSEGRTAGWTSETVSGYRNKDDPFWVGIPGSVILTSMHWRNLRTGGMSSVVTPGTNRDVAWVFNGGDGGTIRANTGTVYAGHNWDQAFNNWGNGSPWGIVARGTGWSTTGNGYYMMVCDALWCHGTHHYNVDVYYVTRNYADNSYW